MENNILLINDMPGYGKVALSAMIPILSNMGCSVYNLPTALVSNTLDYGKGEHPCHRGHKVGEVFDFDTERGKLCPMANHIAFPYIDILRYGGNIPGQPEGTAVFCCSDVDTINVFKIERIEE